MELAMSSPCTSGLEAPAYADGASRLRTPHISRAAFTQQTFLAASVVLKLASQARVFQAAERDDWYQLPLAGPAQCSRHASEIDTEF